MAWQPVFFAVQSFVDDANRRTDVQIRTDAAGAQAFAAAADYPSAILTAPGLLMEAIEGVSLLKPVARYVRIGYEEDNQAPAGNGGYRGNKLVVQYSGSGRNFVMSVPGRDMAALTLAGVNVSVSTEPANGAMGDLVTNLNAQGRDINGNPITVTNAYIND